MFPKGARTDRPYALMPAGVLEVTDTDQLLGSPVYFRAIDGVAIQVGDVISFDDATAVIVLDGDFTDAVASATDTVLRVGDKLLIGTGLYWITEISYASGTGHTTVVINEGAGDAAAAITPKAQLFDDAYLAADMSGEIPFTLVPATGAQKVGFIESPIALRFNVLNVI